MVVTITETGRFPGFCGHTVSEGAGNGAAARPWRSPAVLGFADSVAVRNDRVCALLKMESIDKDVMC